MTINTPPINKHPVLKGIVGVLTIIFCLAMMLFFGWVALAAFGRAGGGGRPAQPSLPVYAVTADGLRIFLWPNAEAWDKAFEMQEAGIATKRPDLYAALASCLFASGTRVAVLRRGISDSTVTVADGPQIGCEGLIPNKWLKDNPDAVANKG